MGLIPYLLLCVSLHGPQLKTCGNNKKKLDLSGITQPRGIVLKKKTFSRRSRKPLNLCPTYTQRHRSFRDTVLALDLCFDVGQTR